jgi:very-short-patch-repair endonuclease
MNSKPTTRFARTLRRNMTDAEKRLWLHLRGGSLAEYKFRRQHPIGPYVADFACPACKLVVELDGGQHALNQASDERRTRELSARGYRVLRFWDHEALTNTQGVLDAIFDSLTSSPNLGEAGAAPHPNPLLREERGRKGGRPLKGEEGIGKSRNSLSLERERVRVRVTSGRVFVSPVGMSDGHS